MIADSEITGADPAAVIEQYKRYVFKLAKRYISILERSGVVGLEDLHQAGFLAIMDAQKRYNPEQGKFINWLFFYIRKYMRDTVGINPNTGAAPARLVYLDEPLADDEEDYTLLDTIADPDAVPMDEPIIEKETRNETASQVRAALDRMKSDKQRTAVSLVWMEGKTREQAAEEMQMKQGAFYSLENYGRSTLRRDWQLRQFAQSLPFVHVGLSKFNTTWTSATEYAALWRLEHLPDDDYISRKEAAAEEYETGRHWSPAQQLAQMNRLIKKRMANGTSGQE